MHPTIGTLQQHTDVGGNEDPSLAIDATFNISCLVMNIAVLGLNWMQSSLFGGTSSGELSWE